jgi:glycosyltransferase involved in cell wall biosynthesis
MARCIEALAEDEGKRSRLSDEAYKTALNFNWQNIAKRYLELFEHLLVKSK